MPNLAIPPVKENVLKTCLQQTMATVPQSEAEVGEIAPTPSTGGRKSMPVEGRVIRGTKGVFVGGH